MGDGDGGADGGADSGGSDGGGANPSPTPEVDSGDSSNDTDLNDRSSGVVAQDPVSASGQGFTNSSVDDALGGSDQALGNAAARLIDALNQNGINSDISGLSPSTPQPYSLLNDIEKVYAGKDSASSVGQAVRSLASDTAFGTAMTFFGGAVGVLTAPEVAFPLELADMGLLDFSAFYSAAQAFANGAAVAGQVTSVFDWADFIGELPQKTAVRAAAIQDVHDNTRPSVFDSPTPAPGPTPAASRMPDISIPNSFLLK